jgi:hypothetical protein
MQKNFSGSHQTESMASPLRQTLAQTKNNSKQKMVDLTIHNHPLANKTRNKKKDRRDNTIPLLIKKIQYNRKMQKSDCSTHTTQ